MFRGTGGPASGRNFFTRIGEVPPPDIKDGMYLKGLTPEARKKCFDDLFLYDIPALVIARNLDCFPECLQSAQEHEKTLLRTEETTVDITSHTIEYLNRGLAPSVTRHGVLMDVYGEGVMITGDSGIGKSETAIELVMRGHRLVADDAVEIRRVSNELIGTAPEVIRHYIELRGIGVIDVRQLFGMRAIKTEAPIDLVVQLEQWDSEKVYDRLGLEDHYTDIMPNPYYIEELRHKNGLDKEVFDYVMGFQQTKDYLRKLEDLLAFTLPLYAEEGKTVLVIAVGCTGGHHRSVAVTHALSEFIRAEGYQVSEHHRDMTRG